MRNLLDTILARTARLASAPLALTLLLTIPLWLWLDNIVVALAAAVLLAFLAAMLHSLLSIRASPDPQTQPLHTTPMPADFHTLLPCPAMPAGLPQPDAQALAGAVRLADELRLLVEPACGVALAAAYQEPPVLAVAKNVVVIVCGGTSVSAALLESWRPTAA